MFKTKNNERQSGFTLLEAVIALFLAASGFVLLYQSYTGAAKIHASAIELQEAEMVANGLMIRARNNEFPTSASGTSGAIAWNVQILPLGRNQMGVELVQVQVLAAGSTGREVQLLTEYLRKGAL